MSVCNFCVYNNSHGPAKDPRLNWNKPPKVMATTASYDADIISRINIVLNKYRSGLKVCNAQLYTNALSVGSYENERMEYLGDAVIGLMAARDLYHAHPKANEGALSKYRVDIVRGSALASLCLSSGVVTLLPDVVSHNLSDKVLEDSIESFVAAIFLDHGLDECNAWFRGALAEHRESKTQQIQSNKSRVREFCKKTGKKIRVNTTKSKGEWATTIAIDGVVVATGKQFSSARVAESNAYDVALEYVDMISIV